jgi:hypothetical protein
MEEAVGLLFDEHATAFAPVRPHGQEPDGPPVFPDRGANDDMPAPPAAPAVSRRSVVREVAVALARFCLGRFRRSRRTVARLRGLPRNLGDPAPSVPGTEPRGEPRR